MQKSKLFEFISKLEEEQWDRLNLFLKSPYFNSRPEVTRLYEFLYKNYLKSGTKDLTKEEAHAFIFPNTPFDNQKIRHLMSYLKNQIESFFVIEKLQQNPIQKKLLVLDSLLDMYPIEKSYSYNFNGATSSLKEQKKRDSTFYENTQKLYDIADKNFLLKRQRKNDNNLQYASNALDQYYVLKKLKYLCSMRSRERILSANYTIYYLDEISKWRDSEILKSVPLVQIYFSILNMLQKDYLVEEFSELQQLIQKHKSEIAKDEMQEVFQYLINFCLASLRKGKDEFVDEALNLYITGIEDEILLKNGFLSPWTYTNVVKLALRKEKFDWIHQFLYQNKKRLPKPVRTNVLNYNLAEVHFYKKEFNEALMRLREVEFDDLTFNLTIRVMLAKIYFEQKDHEVLRSLLTSFIIYLKRSKKISTELKQTNLNFCKFLKRIMKTKNSSKLVDLEKEIKSCELLTDRSWLLKKLNLIQ